MKENCQNSKTRDDIDMKLEPVTKIENGNKTTSKNLVMTSFWYIMTSLLCFLIYGQFGSIRKLHSRRIVCKTHISIESNFLFYKNWKQKSYKNFNTVLTILFWVKVLFWQKFCSFSKKKKTKKKCWHQQNQESLGTKRCNLWNNICVYIPNLKFLPKF